MRYRRSSLARGTRPCLEGNFGELNVAGGGPSASRWGFGGLECDGRVAPRFDGGSQDERFFGDARLDVSGGWMLILGSKGKLRFGEFQTFLYRFFFFFEFKLEWNTCVFFKMLIKEACRLV